MPAKTQRWYKVPCPKCGVAAGINCYQNGGTIHPERLRSAEIEFPVPVRGGWLPVTRMVEQCTTACRKQRHDRCSGFLKANHGMKLPCLCPHHRKKKLYIGSLDSI